MSPNLEKLVTKQVSEEYDYLAPDRSEIRLLAQVNGGGLAHCALPIAGVSRAVAHRTVEEIWYCVSGLGEVWRKLASDEQVLSVRPGISFNIPTGTSFQFRNTGEDILCFVIATIPRWPGELEAIAVPGLWPTE